MRYRYRSWDPRWLKMLKQFKDLLELFHHLLMKTGGDVEQSLDFMRQLQQQRYIPPGVDLDDFRRQLESEGYIQQFPGGARLTTKGEKKIRRDNLEAIFGAL